MPFPPPGDIPNPRIKSKSPAAPAMQEDSLPAEPSGIASINTYMCVCVYIYIYIARTLNLKKKCLPNG